MKLKVCLLAWIWAAALLGSARGQSEETQDNWPQWRGPTLNGVAPRGANPPIRWSATENVKWKKEIAGRGESTPIIWGRRLFILTAIPLDKKIPVPHVVVPGAKEQKIHSSSLKTWKAQRFVVMCLDRWTGDLLWQKTVREAMPHQSHHYKGSYASASPMTDGERLYAYFGSYGLYCFDMEGQLLWDKDIGPFLMEEQLGEGGSPALHGDTLVINCDHEGQSFIVALDKMTGDERWRQNRDEISTWSTPLIFEHEGRFQVVSNATRVRSYDLETGELLWQCAGQTESAIPVPVTGHGLVFVASGYADDVLQAIRLGRRGDLTGTDAIAWELTKGAPYVPTPLLWDDELYVLEDKNFLSCFNAADGTARYFKQRIPGGPSFSASPIGAADRIYLLSEDGDAYVIQRGPEFKLLATNSIEEVCYASPVMIGELLYLRGERHLFCLEQSP